jgi:hypothetical protein
MALYSSGNSKGMEINKQLACPLDFLQLIFHGYVNAHKSNEVGPTHRGA